MTAYSSFIRDFPIRCRDLLLAFEDTATKENREVTLLITIATSAFTIPYERLRSSSPDHLADDRYPEAVGKLSTLENRNFSSWQNGITWQIIEDVDAWQIRGSQADAWAGPDKRCPIPTDKKVGSVLNIIRNALAHGNIFTYPHIHSRQPPSKIDLLIFLSQIRDKETKEFIGKYNVLLVSPNDFRTLILDWISFLEKLELPSEIMQEKI